MGNCLNSSTSDDISLLHESQSDRASFGDGTDPQVPDQEAPPPYQVQSASIPNVSNVYFTTARNRRTNSILNTVFYKRCDTA